jgi:hypothetical protein
LIDPDLFAIMVGVGEGTNNKEDKMSKLDKKIRSLLVSYGELSLQQRQVQQSPTTRRWGREEKKEAVQDLARRKEDIIAQALGIFGDLAEATGKTKETAARLLHDRVRIYAEGDERGKMGRIVERGKGLFYTGCNLERWDAVAVRIDGEKEPIWMSTREVGKI